MSTDGPSVQISPRVNGYLPGRRQLSRHARLSFRAPRQFELREAQRYLSDTFGLDMAAEPSPRQVSARGLDRASAGVLVCVCALARNLQQAMGLPVFEPEAVRGVLPDANEARLIHADLLIATVERVPAVLIARTYTEAMRICLAFTRSGARRGDLQAMADTLDETLIRPGRAVAGWGLSTLHILREADARGVPILHLGGGLYQLGTGARARLLLRSATDRDSAIGSQVSVDKFRTGQLLRSIGAPVPETRRVRDAETVARAVQELGFPLVVKPADRDRGEGVTVDIATGEAALAAYAKAAALSDNVLAQRRVPGNCHRIVTFEGRFVFAYTRHPAAVAGDGSATVTDLVRLANAREARKAKHLRTRMLPLDAEAERCLAAQGHSADTVLPEGTVAFLRESNTADHPGHNEIVTDRLHPDNIELAERVSRLLRLECVGLDLISADPARPWHETGAAITELNFKPQVGANTAIAYMDGMFPGGRAAIDVECLIGGDAAMVAGVARRAELAAAGVAAALTSHRTTLGPDGETRQVTDLEDLFARTHALLQDTAVEALVLVVQTDEILRRGRPMGPPAGRVTIVDGDLRALADPQRRLEPRAQEALAAILGGG